MATILKELYPFSSRLTSNEKKSLTNGYVRSYSCAKKNDCVYLSESNCCPERKRSKLKTQTASEGPSKSPKSTSKGSLTS